MYSNVNTSSLEQLDKLTSGPVSPAGVLRHDGSTHGAGGVPVEPGGHAVLAEDVLAVEQGGAPVVVVADGTGAAGTGGLQLFGTGRSPETLK